MIDMPLIIVKWHDAQVDAGWDTVITKVAEITSVGWKLHEDEKSVVLAADVCDKPQPPHPDTTETYRRIAIPKDWITSVKDVSING